MLEFLKSAFGALPSVATSPLAFVAYLAVVIAWVLIALKVTRNKQLLANLDKLPEHARLEALEMEMGTARLASGLSPEQWIRTRIHRYYFLGFAIISLVAVVLFVVSITISERRGEANADITLYDDPATKDAPPETIPAVARREPTDLKVVNAFDGTGVTGTLYTDEAYIESTGRKPPPQLTLTYAYEREGERINVKPQMPYLNLLAKGGPVTPISYVATPFHWQFPKLSIKVVNNTNRTLFISEAAVEVKRSAVNREPVIVFSAAMANLVFTNEGWGRVNNPRVEFGVTRAARLAKLDVAREPTEHEVGMKTFDQEGTVEIDHDIHVGAELAEIARAADEGQVCVFGVIRYTTDDRKERSLKFKTLVTLDPEFGAGEDPSYSYDLFLTAGKSGYTKRMALSQSIKPGEADHFLVRIATDKSASFDLGFTFRDTGGAEIPTDEVRLAVFVPRSQTEFIAHKEPE